MKDAKAGEILERMLQAVGSTADNALAKAIGVSAQAVSEARRKQKVPPAWAITLAEEYTVSLDWIWFGKEQAQEHGGNYELEKKIAVLEGRLEEKQIMIDRLLELNKGAAETRDVDTSAPSARLAGRNSS